jgi:hypothetical protein
MARGFSKAIGVRTENSVQIDVLAKADFRQRRKDRSDYNPGNHDHDQGHIESDHLIEDASDFFAVIAVEAIFVGRVPHRKLLARYRSEWP